MKNKKLIWISLSAVAVLIILASIFKGGKKPLKVETEKIEAKTIVEVVSVTGKIQPEKEVKISPDVSGEITEMYVQEGDTVKQGQLLLTINPEIYITTLNQLQANLDNAKAALSGAEAQEIRAKAALKIGKTMFERQKKLHEERVISDQEWENAKMQYEQQRTEATVSEKNRLASSFNVKSLTARLDEGQKTLGRTRIYAPEDGVVTQLSSEKGERVVGTAQMAGTEIMRISNLQTMEVEVNINENDIVRVKIGDSADIRIDAYNDQLFRGVVTEIANSAKFNAAQDINEQVTNYTVKIRIDKGSYQHLITKNKPQPLLPGMTASADIKTTVRKDVAGLPISALTSRVPFTGKKAKDQKEDATWVFVYRDGKAVAVSVRTGIQDLDYFECTEGLKIGDEVITEPSMSIAKTMLDGDEVVK